MKTKLAIVAALLFVGMAAVAAPQTLQYAGEATLGIMMRDLKSGREVLFVCAPFTPPEQKQPASPAKPDIKANYEVNRD